MKIDLEKVLAKKIAEVTAGEDPAHDFLHFKRVVATAKALCIEEDARMEIVMPAAWLHDFVLIPKNDPRRSQASKLSAISAIAFLKQLKYPEEYYDGIAHAIAAHGFSANIETKTLEAEIVQDADRLDGLGAIGIARVFATSGLLKRPFYSDVDPLCKTREPDDQKFTVDHFFAKLFKTVETLKTKTGKAEGARRVAVMKRYLVDLGFEITFDPHNARRFPPKAESI
jgi:uncharacterized protein